MRLLRAPLLHFLAAGALLLLFKMQFITPAPSTVRPTAPEPVVISAAEVARLRADFAGKSGRAPTPEDERELVARVVDEELLYREALARGLDRGDRSVRYRLAEKMRFLDENPERSEDELYRAAIEIGLDRNDAVVRRILVNKMRLLASLPAGETEPDGLTPAGDARRRPAARGRNGMESDGLTEAAELTSAADAHRRPDALRPVARGRDGTDAELQAYLQAHPDRYRQPARVTLSHVFLSAARRGDRLERDAAETRAALARDAVAPERAIEAGDPFPLGHRFSSNSAKDLAKIFGNEFAERVMAVEPGSWSESIPSAFGLHVVFVEAKEPESVAPLSTVRSQVKQALVLEQRSRRVEEFLDELRSKYQIEVETPARGP